MSVRSWDPAGAFRLLDEHGVDFVVIGGLAASLHGSTSVTDDTDICYDTSDENLQRLAAALTVMNARLRGVADEVPFILDAKTLKAGQNFTFVTDYGSLDCLGQPAGVQGFDELSRNAVRRDVHGVTVAVCSIRDLMNMKRAAGRPVDLRELEILGALVEEVDEEERRSREGDERDGPNY